MSEFIHEDSTYVVSVCHSRDDRYEQIFTFDLPFSEEEKCLDFFEAYYDLVCGFSFIENENDARTYLRESIKDLSDEHVDAFVECFNAYWTKHYEEEGFEIVFGRRGLLEAVDSYSTNFFFIPDYPELETVTSDINEVSLSKRIRYFN